jgi:hypothetical protein
MNRVQSFGIFERLLYGAFLFLAMQGVARKWWDADTAAYIATGALALVGGVWGWWVNRPSALLTDAASQLPGNAQLVITTRPIASLAEKVAVRALANSASDRVSARTEA